MGFINRKEYKKSGLRSVFRWMPSPLLRVVIVLALPLALVIPLFSDLCLKESLNDFMDSLFAKYV